MKKAEPVITYMETLSYAIQYTHGKYWEKEQKARQQEEQGRKEGAEIMRELAQPWKEKADILRKLYELETGQEYPYEFE